MGVERLPASSLLSPVDVGSLTAFNGASVLFEILCLLAEAWEARRTPG